MTAFANNSDQFEQLLEANEGTWFIGKVENANDPLGLNRVQVRVSEFYEGATTSLPWAIPVKSASMGQGSGYGVYGAPVAGSDVLVLIQNGNPHYPLYFAIQLEANSEFGDGTWGWKDSKGNKFIVNADGSQEWSASCGFKFKVGTDCKVTLDAPGGFEVNTPDMYLNGNFRSYGTMANNGMDVGSTHVHYVGRAFNPTGTPMLPSVNP